VVIGIRYTNVPPKYTFHVTVEPYKTYYLFS
jgi:hypothetical protein